MSIDNVVILQTGTNAAQDGAPEHSDEMLMSKIKDFLSSKSIQFTQMNRYNIQIGQN